nr:copia protein [Tanacetum cinerariifolium]
MIIPSKDILYNGRKGIGFENPRYFEKAKDLRPSLYDEKVIGLGYTLMFLTHSDEALEIEKFKRARENKIEFAYDYGNLNASYVNEKINFEDDYFQEIINPDFEKIDSPFQQTSSLKPYVSNVILEKIIIDLEDEVVSLLEKEKVNLKTIESLKSKGFESSENAISESENQSENDCHVVEKECDKVESSKVIAPGMFKLSVSQSVSSISKSKTSCESNNVENSLDLSLDHRFGMFKAYDGEDSSETSQVQTAFASNKPLYLLHMDLCGPMRVESINGKRYVLVVVDDYSRYTLVLFLHSKDEASKVIISFIKKTQVNLQIQVRRVQTDNGTINLGLWYPKDYGFDLTAYSDADHARCHLDRKAESEYVAVSRCCAPVLWMRTQLTDYGFFYDKVPIYCDSKSVIAISCNLIQVAQKKVKIAFENADSNSKVELIPSKIKYANK